MYEVAGDDTMSDPACLKRLFMAGVHVLECQGMHVVLLEDGIRPSYKVVSCEV